VWRYLSKYVLQPDHPFALHSMLLKLVFSSWNAEVKGPIPVWMPTSEGIRDTNLAAFMSSFQAEEWLRGKTGNPQVDLDLLQRISHSDPEAFWPPVLAHLRIHFHQRPSRIFEHASNPDDMRWLPGARLNIAESALCVRDQDAPALLWAEEESPDIIHALTLGELRLRAQHFAAALRAAGHTPGQAIAIDMPMTVEAVVAYFGIVLAGCAAVSIADSFAAAEIAMRLRISNAAAIVTQDVIGRGKKLHRLYARVVEADAPRAIVVPANAICDGFHEGLVGLGQVSLRRGDVSWEDFLKGAPLHASFQAHVADASDVTNILFSSGTTGEPKAIPWTHVTPMRCGVDAWAQQDVRRGDVVAWPTNLGWMMGPWLLYAALLNGAAVALQNCVQGSPLARPFGIFVERAQVNVLGLVPSIAKAWRASGCMKGLKWASLRCYSSTGEASAPEDYHWLMARGGYKPVIEICGGTEIGGGFLAGCMLQPQSPSTFSTPTMGSNFVLLTASGRQSMHGDRAAVVGELAVVPPLLGSSQRLLNRDHHSVYYKDMDVVAGTYLPLRRHGDEFERLPNGYYKALGRCDDTMNLGGIKASFLLPACLPLDVSSVELERACMESVPSIIEAAAVSVPAPGGGPEQLVLFLVPRGKRESTDAVKRQCQAAIRSKLNPLFKVERVLWRDSLPRTASNKVMRRLLRDELRSHSRL
ncbi:acetyl-CoA synthetase-like protein, partial [Coccomyxa subellipsoidea C-169]